MSNRILNDFLAARQMIDRNPADTDAGKKKEEKTTERPVREAEDNVKMIIETKPSKKVVMDFLKKKVAQYTDISSSDED